MPEKRKTKVGFAGETREIDVTVPDGEPQIWGADAKLRVVGTRVPRIDGVAKATGRAEYTTDVRLKGLCHARVFRAPSPGGKVRSIDVSAAEKAPGVVYVRVMRQPGQPVLMEGQDLAIVVAETPDQAEDAIRLCKADIESGPVIVDVETAKESGSPTVHASSDSNVRRGGRGGAGNADAAFAKADEAMKRADIVLERTYRTQVQTHSALEPHGVVIRPDEDGGVTVWCSTQGTFSVRDGLSGALKIDQSKVHAIAEHVGGGFGAKFGVNAHGSSFGNEAARAAMSLKRPVRCILDRREEHLVGGNRPSSVQQVRIGATKAGEVVAYTARIYGTAGISEGGAGASNPMIYGLGATAKDEFTVVTQAGPSTAFRAPGHPQGSFALEQAIDEMAAALDTDPLEFRLRLDKNPVRRWQYQEGAKRFGWAEKRKRANGKGPFRRGVGMGSAVWYNGGGPGATVSVTAHRDGSVEVSNGAQDIGTGTRTVLAVIVAEVLGLDVADVKVNLGRSELPFGPGSGGSTTAASIGPCARNAAEAARSAVLGEAKPSKAAWKSACAKMEGESQTFTGGRGPAYERYQGQTAGCQFVEVEVDTDTGVVRVVKVLAMQDCGRVIDALTAESQVIGAVIGGISWALFEDRVMDPKTGRLLNGDLEAYRIAGPRDVPDVEVMMTDVANAGNSVGMMGLGEPPAIPTAGAIANAIAHALSGVGDGSARVREAPMTPARVIAAIEAAERAAKGGK
ncbi:MAG: xanthine dehydrogenase family protein molybdopterin-binding subunit [Planctomycetes bacterium]|nr:xanthine dehydrogenase family protein molybdopterin-binding subunit [Planctomycetota bacterium]